MSFRPPATAAAPAAPTDPVSRLRAIAADIQGKADPASLSAAISGVATAVADAIEAGASQADEPDFL